VLLLLVLLGYLLLFHFRRIHKLPYLVVAQASEIILGSTNRWLNVPLLQVRLSQEEQRYHTAIFGRSGSGKSRLLQSLFLQHVSRGKGVGLIEPHNDLSKDCLKSLIAQGFYASRDAYQQVVYIDWANGAYIPFNVLKSDAHPDTIAKNVLNAMLRVWPELRTAPAFQNLFDSGVKCLIANDLTLAHLFQLLVNKEFRQACLSRVSDPLVLQNFAYFDTLGRDQPNLIGSTLRRAYLLTSHHLTRYTLGQPDNVLDFRKLMDQGRAFIINLGNVGDDETTSLLGALLLIQIEQAAKSRTDIPEEEDRVPCTLIVDEWPAFAAQEDSIAKILSQCRKFGLFLYLSAQSLAQVDSRRLVGALENCKLEVAFGLGYESAETQARHIGDVDPLLIKEEQLTPVQHNAFMAIQDQYAAWAQELQNMRKQYCYVKLENVPAVKIRTLNTPRKRVSSDTLGAVLETYKGMYQRTRAEAEAAMASIKLPNVPTRDDVDAAYGVTGLDWQDKTAA
jgi:hypothetical protein